MKRAEDAEGAEGAEDAEDAEGAPCLISELGTSRKFMLASQKAKRWGFLTALTRTSAFPTTA